MGLAVDAAVLYLVPGRLDVDASLGQRGLHADKEGALQRVVWSQQAGTGGLHCGWQTEMQLLSITFPISPRGESPGEGRDIKNMSGYKSCNNFSLSSYHLQVIV